MNTKIIIFLFLLVLFILFAYFFVNNVKIRNLTLAELFEFTNLSKNNISKYLEEKYGMKNIRFTNIDLHTDGYRNSLFSYNPPKYDGWVIASVKANGIKKFTVLSYTNFLEQGIETQKLCYDNYQKSEIKNAISSYLEELVGQPAEYQEIVVEDTTLPVFLTYSSKLKNNNKYLFANKYDGNLLDFISNDNISCNVDNYYLNAKTVNIPVEHFNSIKLTNYSSEKALKERLSRLNESTSWWSHYLPYIIDSYNYNVRTANISYELIELEQTYEGIKYYNTDSNKKLNISNMKTEINEFKLNNINERIKIWRNNDTNYLNEYNNKIVSDFYIIPKDTYLYFPISLIENYDASKTYLITLTDTDFSHTKIEKINNIINNEYIFINTDGKTDSLIISFLESDKKSGLKLNFTDILEIVF